MFFVLFWPLVAVMFYLFRVDVSACLPSLALHFPSFLLAIWLLPLASVVGLPRKMFTLFNLLFINAACELLQLLLAGATFDIWDLVVALLTTLVGFYFYRTASAQYKILHAHTGLWIPAFLVTLGCDVSFDAAYPVFIPRSEVLAEITYDTAAHRYTFDNLVVWGNYLAVLDKEKGVAILDNTDPLQPAYVGYINVPAATYLAVKDNLLWVNHYNDFLYFSWDADLGAIQAGRLENKVSYFNYISLPIGTDWINDSIFENESQEDSVPAGMVVTGYYIK